VSLLDIEELEGLSAPDVTIDDLVTASQWIGTAIAVADVVVTTIVIAT
jgi:hypothetical protein